MAAGGEAIPLPGRIIAVADVYDALISKRHRLATLQEQGLGDIAAANLTITSARHERVDFSDPLATGIRELVARKVSLPPDVGLQQAHTRSSFRCQQR